MVFLAPFDFPWGTMRSTSIVHCDSTAASAAMAASIGARTAPTTPTVPNTPLQAPNTNLAGVFQINDVSQVNGLRHTFNSWIVSKAGFFGKNTQATLTIFAVNGTAPALINGSEKPISNVIRETFTIAA